LNASRKHTKIIFNGASNPIFHEDFFIKSSLAREIHAQNHFDHAFRAIFVSDFASIVIGKMWVFGQALHYLVTVLRAA
jgi:hypothetical protein